LSIGPRYSLYAHPAKSREAISIRREWYRFMGYWRR
jgi:hypothetical protein